MIRKFYLICIIVWPIPTPLRRNYGLPGWKPWRGTMSRIWTTRRQVFIPPPVPIIEDGSPSLTSCRHGNILSSLRLFPFKTIDSVSCKTLRKRTPRGPRRSPIRWENFPNVLNIFDELHYSDALGKIECFIAISMLRKCYTSLSVVCVVVTSVFVFSIHPCLPLSRQDYLP